VLTNGWLPVYFGDCSSGGPASCAGRASGCCAAATESPLDGVGEWSFIETLRHLVFATDAWVKRAILGKSSPWDSLDLPHDDMPDEPSIPRDRDARPSLDEVLTLRADRMATVRKVVADLTDEKLVGMTEPVLEPGYPESESFAVRRCLGAIVNEEREHRLYAERDFDVLESRASAEWLLPRRVLRMAVLPAPKANWRQPGVDATRPHLELPNARPPTLRPASAGLEAPDHVVVNAKVRTLPSGRQVTKRAGDLGAREPLG
jgi:hypothetical protein